MWIWLLACQAPLSEDPEAVARGWDALRYGDYVGSGVPADLWFELVSADAENRLARDGLSAGLAPAYNLFEAPNGVEVVGGLTCFGCHAGEVDGVFYPGLGNPRVDFANEVKAQQLGLLQELVAIRYGRDSPEWEASFPFFRGAAAVADATLTPFAGVNPAFSLERAAVAHRDPQTLEWQDDTWFPIPDAVIWSDTPAWWHLQKRSDLYWTGFGRGEVERLLLQISTVAVLDSAHAAELLEDFGDIRAWIEALEPPAYPGGVDEALAAEGEVAFAATCSRCHGTYGEGGAYPNLVVALDEVGTDPVYAQAFDGTPFVDWLNESWFASGGEQPPPELGYVAPPLDGIWATAPYLHNGSVPNLVSLLDPNERPALWRRDPQSSALDHERMGWPYEVPETADTWTYDTAVDGASAVGHPYGLELDASGRRAVLEYLKTL